MPGRPKYKSDLEALRSMPEDMIWAMIEDGKTITQICYELGVGRRPLQAWLDQVDADEAKMARARAKAATSYAMQALEIADSSEPEQAAKARLQIQARQWIAERWNQKLYGGQRKNAGRKKSAHPTTTIAFRVRLALVDEIKQLVKQFITTKTQTKK